jgi:hypothetical protein
MQGRCAKLLKVSEHSSSDEKFVEALDNGTCAPFCEQRLKLRLISG